MLHGLWKLTWLEIKIFLREPLGVVGAVGVPVILFVLFGRLFGSRGATSRSGVPRVWVDDLPILASMLIAVGAVLSLVTIIAIYRESGILKRLRATPLRPFTILTAHVIVKLLLSAVALAAMVLAGRRYYPIGPQVPLISFALALLLSTLCILSIGFLIASLVPTARFAQPVGSLILYPMLGVSGLFVPIAALPSPVQTPARLMPLSCAVSLLRGVWTGEGWAVHMGDVAGLLLTFAVCLALASRTFRWE